MTSRPDIESIVSRPRCLIAQRHGGASQEVIQLAALHDAHGQLLMPWGERR